MRSFVPPTAVGPAVVVGEAVDHDVIQQRLRARLTEQLSEQKVPRHLIVLYSTDLPRTELGKVDRQELAAVITREL